MSRVKRVPIISVLPRTEKDAICMELLSDLYGADRENTKAALLAAKMGGANICETAAGYWLGEAQERRQRNKGRSKRYEN